MGDGSRVGEGGGGGAEGGEEVEERMAMEQFSFPFLCLEFPFLSFSISAFDDFLSVRFVGKTICF